MSSETKKLDTESKSSLPAHLDLLKSDFVPFMKLSHDRDAVLGQSSLDSSKRNLRPSFTKVFHDDRKDAVLYNWTDLPHDMTAEILGRLGAVEILKNAQFVCSSWYKICKDPFMWRRIDVRNWGKWNQWVSKQQLFKMCKQAVEYGAGVFTDINIEDYGNDDLLLYIAPRSSNLRRLRLYVCHDISNDALIKAASMFPLLEELEITFCSGITGEALQTIGRLCPLLRSLKYNKQGFRTPHLVCDDEAFAIGKNMPALRELELLGNKLTNNGLMAILDGCPHIESLDLRDCFNVNLEEEGVLEKRCLERVKFLRRPNDSVDWWGSF